MWNAGSQVVAQHLVARWGKWVEPGATWCRALITTSCLNLSLTWADPPSQWTPPFSLEINIQGYFWNIRVCSGWHLYASLSFSTSKPYWVCWARSSIVCSTRGATSSAILLAFEWDSTFIGELPGSMWVCVANCRNSNPPWGTQSYEKDLL